LDHDCAHPLAHMSPPQFSHGLQQIIDFEQLSQDNFVAELVMAISLVFSYQSLSLDGNKNLMGESGYAVDRKICLCAVATHRRTINENDTIKHVSNSLQKSTHTRTNVPPLLRPKSHPSPLNFPSHSLQISRRVTFKGGE